MDAPDEFRIRLGQRDHRVVEVLARQVVDQLDQDVFHSASGRRNIPAYDLDLSRQAGDGAPDAIIASENPEHWLFSNWELYWPTIVGIPA